jgi:hypothetical protein
VDEVPPVRGLSRSSCSRCATRFANCWSRGATDSRTLQVVRGAGFIGPVSGTEIQATGQTADSLGARKLGYNGGEDQGLDLLRGFGGRSMFHGGKAIMGGSATRAMWVATHPWPGRWQPAAGEIRSIRGAIQAAGRMARAGRRACLWGTEARGTWPDPRQMSARIPGPGHRRARPRGTGNRCSGPTRPATGPWRWIPAPATTRRAFQER